MITSILRRLPIITDEAIMTDLREPIHPGEILADELAEIGIKPLALAERIGVPNNRIYQIIDGKRSITADTALRLGKFFNTGPEFWLNLQKAYELELARQEMGESLEHIEPYHTRPNVRPKHAVVGG
jgi:addiction module HigA family antidote